MLNLMISSIVLQTSKTSMMWMILLAMLLILHLVKELIWQTMLRYQSSFSKIMIWRVFSSFRFRSIFTDFWRTLNKNSSNDWMPNSVISKIHIFFHYRYQLEAVDVMKRNLNQRLMVMGVDLLWVEPGCLMDIIGSNFRTCMRSVWTSKYMIILVSHVIL